MSWRAILAVILVTLLLIAVTGFATEMFRIALVGRPDFEKWSFIGYPLSATINSLSTGTAPVVSARWCGRPSAMPARDSPCRQAWRVP